MGTTPAPRPPPRSATDGNALLNALGSRDLGSSTRAVEQLYTMCLTDQALCRQVAAGYLGSVIRLLESPYPNCKMHGAYLLSALVGCSPSCDAEMTRLEIAPSLVQILGSCASPGLARGLLRALSKMLGGMHGYQVQFLGQVIECSGLSVIAASLGSKELGVVRRCLELLEIAFRDCPDVVPQQVLPASEFLVLLLSCGVPDVQLTSLNIINAMSRHVALLAAGCGEGLEQLASSGTSGELRAGAARVLSKIRPALLTFPSAEAEDVESPKRFQPPDSPKPAPAQRVRQPRVPAQIAPHADGDEPLVGPALKRCIADLHAASLRKRQLAAHSLSTQAMHDPGSLEGTEAVPALLQCLVDSEDVDPSASPRGSLLKALEMLSDSEVTGEWVAPIILRASSAVAILDGIRETSTNTLHAGRANGILRACMARTAGPGAAAQPPAEILTSLHSADPRVRLRAADAAVALAGRSSEQFLNANLMPRLLELLPECLHPAGVLEYSMRGALLRALRDSCTRIELAAEQVLEAPAAIDALETIAWGEQGPHAVKAKKVLDAVVAIVEQTHVQRLARLLPDLRGADPRAQLAAAEAAAEAAASDPGAVLKLGALPAVLALVASDECVKAQDALQLSLCAALLRTLHTLSEHAPSSAAVCESIVERPQAVAALDSYAAAPAQGAAARHADAVLKAIVRRRQKLARASLLLARQQGHWNDDRGSISSCGLRDSVSVHNDAGDAPPVSPLTINKTAQSVSQENPTPPRVLDPFCPAESPPTHNSHEGSELENSNGFARRALLTRLLGGETVSEPSLHLGSAKGEREALTSGHVSSVGEPQNGGPNVEDLGDWILDASEIEFCKDERGKVIKLGEGGFGVVFKTVQHGVDEVAVKRIRSLSPTMAQLRTFHNEVDCLRRLCHRNIVQFYGACLQPESLFLVTELMAGTLLWDLMKWDRLGKRVAKDVALGLHYLHTRKVPVLHRDLKSPNILLTGEGVAKIADVGMSRRMLSDLATAQAIMTPLWSAPEVLRRERASVKADIWSYGVLLWEIVTGEDITRFPSLALTKSTAPETGREDQPASPVVTMGDDAPPTVKHIFEQCTQTSPALRPSALQIIEWLRDV
ncbi:hypothetical protein QBZ16_001815 [Prototheca wickerhamii]|uniref:Protein kinase domain-containing protein n=1 Tax=Prototheca wickerhamii TaxID=3111 RepID=A0AAD9MLP1_PROWI|nr:hypothetical protein QBZ16_001815 [Prototheca wickerhamii]